MKFNEIDLTIRNTWQKLSDEISNDYSKKKKKKETKDMNEVEWIGTQKTSEKE